MAPDKIYLVGFMAAGKTTVARSLARRLDWRAEDVDELIEARERRPVADIFARSGEAYFRAVEREILKLLLPLRHVVVATGGGTFWTRSGGLLSSASDTAVEVPRVSLLANARVLAGSGWMGLKDREAYVTRGVRITPMFTGLLALAALLAFLTLAWWREGR